MNRTCELKETYHYHDSEYYVIGGVLAELLLYALIVMVYGAFVMRIDLVVMGVFLSIPLIYILYCFYKSCKDGKLKLKVEDGDILLYKLYLLKPYRIKKELIIELKIIESKGKIIVGVRTQKRKHKIKIHIQSKKQLSNN